MEFQLLAFPVTSNAISDTHNGGGEKKREREMDFFNMKGIFFSIS